MIKKISGLNDLKTFLSSHIVPILKPKTILLLNGELGVGKTQAVKFLVDLMGGNSVVSPTFSIIQNYKVKDCLIYHCDLFRVESFKDLEFTGFWDIFNDSKSIVFVEWAEKMNTQKIAGWSMFELNVEFDSAGDTNRKLSFKQLS